MTRNDLQDQKVLKQLFSNLFADRQTDTDEQEFKEKEDLIAAILVVEKCKIFIWIPGVMPIGEMNKLRSEIEEIKGFDTVIEVCRVHNNGREHAMIVCPKCPGGYYKFVARCERVIQKYISLTTTQHMKANAFEKAFPSLGTI